MKKLFILLTVVFLSGCELSEIVDCGENENVSGVCVDSTAPVINGITDITIDINTDFDPLNGVNAEDDIDGNITDLIVVIDQVDETYPGTYIVRYEVEDSFLNKTIKVRYVTVSANYAYGQNMVLNGSFDHDLDGYNFFTYEGAVGDFSVVDGELVAEINSVDGDIWYSPRINYPGLMLENGEYYKVSFKVKADNERYIYTQVGELLSAHPWYDDFSPNIEKIYHVTEEYQTFEYWFKMESNTNNNASLIFELGNVYNHNPLTTLYFDDLEVTRITENDYLSLSSLSAPGVIQAEDFDSMDGVQVEDTGDTGGGQNVGWISTGDTMNYSINVEEEGDYIFFNRVASTQDDRTMNMYLDGNFLFQVDIINTGDWQTYITVASEIIHLEAGYYEFTISSETGGFNINYFEIEKVN